MILGYKNNAPDIKSKVMLYSYCNKIIINIMLTVEWKVNGYLIISYQQNGIFFIQVYIIKWESYSIRFYSAAFYLSAQFKMEALISYISLNVKYFSIFMHRYIKKRQNNIVIWAGKHWNIFIICFYFILNRIYLLFIIYI